MATIIARLFWYFGALAVLACLPTISKADVLQAGDLIVADRAASDHGAIFRVDPITGVQTQISTGGFFQDLTGVAVDSKGNIFVSDRNAFTGALGGVIQVNPTTGVQTPISSAGLFVHPEKLAAGNGALLVANPQGTALVSVNPVTGMQTPAILGGGFGTLTAVAVAANGLIYATNLSNPSIVRVDPASGIETIISSGGFLSRPFGIAIDPDGNLLVTDTNSFGSNNGGLIKVDPLSGAQTVLSEGGFFITPYGVAVGPDGEIFVADQGAGIIRVDPSTGAQTLISSGGLFLRPLSIAVYPSLATVQVPEPSTLALFAIAIVIGIVRFANRNQFRAKSSDLPAARATGGNSLA
jgi:streptogramin lyase